MNGVYVRHRKCMKNGITIYAKKHWETLNCEHNAVSKEKRKKKIDRCAAACMKS